MAVKMVKRKCLYFTIILILPVFCIFETIKNKKKPGILLVASIIITFFMLNHIREGTQRETDSFVNILHNLPVNERRYFVWRTAYEILNSNRSISINNDHRDTTTYNQTIQQLINKTVSRYKVRTMVTIMIIIWC